MTQPFHSAPRRARRRARLAGDPGRPPVPTESVRRTPRQGRRNPPPPRAPWADPRVAAGVVVLGLAVVVAVVLLLGDIGGHATASPSAPLGSSAAASGGIGGSCPTSQPPALAAGQTRIVTISTAKGDIVIKVDGSLSPIAAGNFVALADCGYYDGVVFHRVVPGFVIQGGDAQYGTANALNRNRIGQGGPSYTIQDEPVTATYKRGTVAMARSDAPNSQGSQFFIVLDDGAATSLAAKNTYAIFGVVTSGMEVVDAIAAAADAEIPSNPIEMTSVTVANP